MYRFVRHAFAGPAQHGQQPQQTRVPLALFTAFRGLSKMTRPSCQQALLHESSAASQATADEALLHDAYPPMQPLQQMHTPVFNPNNIDLTGSANVAQYNYKEQMERMKKSQANETSVAQIINDMNNPAKVYGNYPLHQLINAWFVLELCTIDPLVKSAEPIYKFFSSLPIISNLTNFAIHKTVHAHFCAGEQEKEIIPRVTVMRQRRIESIFDYAAEGEVASKKDDKSNDDELNERPITRVYDYKDEDTCDRNLQDFMQSVTRVRKMSPTGVTAIKLTALGQPSMLRAFSDAIISTQELFEEFDEDKSGTLTRQEMINAFKKFFPSIPDEKVLSFMQLTFERSPYPDKIDYIQWSHSLQMTELWDLIHLAGPGVKLTDVAPNEQEITLLGNMMRRMQDLVIHARENNVKLLIDAEHLCFQPAIDNIVLTLQRQHNKEFPYIYQTYQCYRKDTHHRIHVDMERSKREGWIFATKLVRGAYLEFEREQARLNGYEDPIHENIEATHGSYNSAVDLLLDNPDAHVLVATHNKDSIIHTIRGMMMRNMAPSHPRVTFAQLFGMADTLTETLAAHGYYVYKYMPYGPVPLVIPYLIRRAIENSAVMKHHGSDEKMMIRNEIFRRAKAAVGLGKNKQQ